MSWKFWKHKGSNAIISESDHSQLTDDHKKDFTPAPEAKETTHSLDEDYEGGKLDSEDDGSLLTGLLIAETVSDDLGSIGDGPDMGDSSGGNDMPDFGGFGGGDGGGGGAGSDF